jgi:predicted Fe-Mo cluster-binding NifX family protein
MERVGICHHLGCVSPVFDVAGNLKIFGVENGAAQGLEEKTLRGTSPFLRAEEVRAYGVHTVICGAISRALEIALRAEGVRVVSFVCGPVEEVLSAYAQGRVEEERFLMPGCCRNAQIFREWKGRSMELYRGSRELYGRSSERHGRRRMRFHPARGGSMKIAVTSIDGTLEGKVDERFGRCRKLVICDPEANQLDVLDNNTSMGLAQGAGIQTAQNVLNSGAKAVISGHFGPKAFQVLRSAGVETYAAIGMTVKEALARFQEGKLARLTGADVSSHW